MHHQESRDTQCYVMDTHIAGAGGYMAGNLDLKELLTWKW